MGGRGGGIVDGDSRSSVGFSDPLSDLVNLNQAIISQSTGNMSGSFNPNRVFASADESMFWSPNTFKMARAALERLTDPIFLSDGARARFVSTVSQRLGDVVVSFAKTNYLQGFDQLIECGLITQDNIVVITDMVGETANVEATGHLFELRRRYFGYDVMAEFDL